MAFNRFIQQLPILPERLEEMQPAVPAAGTSFSADRFAIAGRQSRITVCEVNHAPAGSRRRGVHAFPVLCTQLLDMVNVSSLRADRDKILLEVLGTQD
jgi:hypothetical protein